MDKNILLLHGWGAETKKLQPLKKELEKLNWRVFVPKIVGFEKPAPSTIWGIRQYSEYIVNEAKNVFKNNKYFVFGHSFGGGITIKLASKKYKNIKGIILCATRGISRGKTIKRILFSVLAKTGKIFLITPWLAENFRKLLYKAAREHDYEKTKGVMRDVFKKVISEDLKPLLVKIKVPTLILWGELDRMTPIKDAHFINKSLPKSVLKIYKDSGHKLPYEKPKQLARDIERWFQGLH